MENTQLDDAIYEIVKHTQSTSCLLGMTDYQGVGSHDIDFRINF